MVLRDLRRPGTGGLAATARISTTHPGIAVVVITMHDDDDSIFAALRAGARGYLLKEADGDAVHRTVLAAARGEALFGPQVARRVAAFFAGALTTGPVRSPFRNWPTENERASDSWPRDWATPPSPTGSYCRIRRSATESATS
jgi:DNA-binding NarL/FixJ family response regulator